MKERESETGQSIEQRKAQNFQCLQTFSIFPWDDKLSALINLVSSTYLVTLGLSIEREVEKVCVLLSSGGGGGGPMKYAIGVKSTLHCNRILQVIKMNELVNTTADFLPQYKAIGQSLKKRFFRKPNVTEAVEQYESLGQELQREEQKTFAAVCFLEAAKCQENLKSFVPQANSLVKAGKLFLSSWESENHFTDETSKDKCEAAHLSGNLELGIQTLSQSAKSFNSQGYKASALCINLQIGDILFRDGEYGEALNYYKGALVEAKQNFSFCDQLMVTELVCKAKVKSMEYESVLKTVNDTLVAIKNFESEIDFPLQVLASYSQKFEIMKVLLVLILGGNTTDILDFIWPKLHSTREFDEDNSTGSPDLCENSDDPDSRREVVYLLKSLVLAVHEGSTQELKNVRDKLFPFMDEIHHDLMRFLMQMQS